MKTKWKKGDKAFIIRKTFFGAIVTIMHTHKDEEVADVMLPWCYVAPIPLEDLVKIDMKTAAHPYELRLTALRKILLESSDFAANVLYQLIHDDKIQRMSVEELETWIKEIRTNEDIISRSISSQRNRAKDP